LYVFFNFSGRSKKKSFALNPLNLKFPSDFQFCFG